MIKVVNPSVEVWKQEGYTLDAIFKHIARCARVCYQSTPKNKDENAYDFFLELSLKDMISSISLRLILRIHMNEYLLQMLMVM